MTGSTGKGQAASRRGHKRCSKSDDFYRCVCEDIHTYIYICIHMYNHIYIHRERYIYIYTCIHRYIHFVQDTYSLRLWTYVHMRMCTDTGSVRVRWLPKAFRTYLRGSSEVCLCGSKSKRKRRQPSSAFPNPAHFQFRLNLRPTVLFLSWTREIRETALHCL